VRVIAESLTGHAGQPGIELDGIDSLKARRDGCHHLSVIRSRLDQRGEAERLRIFPYGALFQKMRDSARFATQLPPPVIGIVAQLFVSGVHRQLFEKRPYGMGGLARRHAGDHRVAGQRGRSERMGQTDPDGIGIQKRSG
jgi:hypothetical protein